MAGGNESQGVVERRTIGELLRAGQYTWAAEALCAAREDCERREDAALTLLLNAAVRLCTLCGQLHAEAERHLRAYQEITQRERELWHQLDAILDLIGEPDEAQAFVPDKAQARRPAWFQGDSYLDAHTPSQLAGRGGLWQRIRRLIGGQPSRAVSNQEVTRSSIPMGASKTARIAPSPSGAVDLTEPAPHALSEAVGAPQEAAVPPTTEEDAARLLGPGPEEAQPPAGGAPEAVEGPDAPAECDSTPVPSPRPLPPGRGSAPPPPSPDETPRPDVQAPAPQKAARLLEVYCLGTFRVYHEGQPVEAWSGRKCKSVLKYLVTHREHPVHLEVLMDLFWRDAEPESARRSLYQAVYQLRQALQNGDPDLPYILSGDECYALAPEVAVWVDSEALLEHYQEGQRLEREGQIEAALLKYEAADNLYEGEFLTEDRYEEWPLLQRENLRQVHMDILDRLSRHYLDRGVFAACTAFCQKILAEDRCREDAHRRLMRCYLRQGQRNLALHQYRLCEEALRQELDVAPMPATIALYRQIQAGAVQFPEGGELNEK